MTIAIARAAARKFLKEAMAGPPVDVMELVRWRGLELFYEPNWPKELCGRYYPANRRISMNGQHHRTRQRFSVAHELGHFTLGHEHIDEFDTVASVFGDEKESFNVTNDVEREANAFATELLMPREWVLQLSKQRPATQELVKVIRQGCDVSEPAAWYRIMELKLGGFASPRHRRR